MAGEDLLQEYECDCCAGRFFYEEVLKSYDGEYAELYLICPDCGGECFPVFSEEQEDF